MKKHIILLVLIFLIKDSFCQMNPVSELNPNDTVYSKFDNIKSIELNKIIGGRSSDTGTCPTDYTTSEGNPDCTADDCTDVVCADTHLTHQ